MNTQLGLSKKEIDKIYADADENEDGCIEYKEFVPLMVDIIGAQQAKALAHDAKLEDEAAAREEVELLLLHGLSRDDLEVRRSLSPTPFSSSASPLSPSHFLLPPAPSHTPPLVTHRPFFRSR